MATASIYKLVAELLADTSDYTKKMKAANVMAEETKSNMEKVQTAINGISNKLLVVGGGLTATGGALVKGATDWGRGFADLQSTLEVNTKQMKQMKKLAIEFSNDHKISSDSIITSYYNMSSAGMDFNAIMASTADVGTLAIAAAQPLQDMGSAMDDAVNVFTDSLNVYKDAFDNMGLTLEQRSSVIMNTVAGTVQAFKTTLPQMREALKNVAGDAARAGMSFEGLNASLGLLMSNGKQAGEAGTGLRSVLTSLQTKAADFGINVFEANGSLRDLSAIMAEVEQYMNGFSSETEKAKAMTTLFGEEQQGIAKILMANVENLEKQAAALKDSSVALEMAAYREADLGSQMEILKNNFANLGASLGEFLIPMMHEIKDALKEFAQWMQQLSPETQKFIAQVAGIGGPLMLAAGGVGKLVANIMTMGPAFSLAGKGIVGLSKGIIGLSKNLMNLVPTIISSVMAGKQLTALDGGNFTKMGGAIKTARNSMKTFNQLQPKMASAIGWTGILTAGLAAISIALKPLNDETKQLFDQMNEFNQIEVKDTFWNSLPFIGDTIKSHDYANAMEDYVNKMGDVFDNGMEAAKKLRDMQADAWGDPEAYGEVKKQAEEYLHFIEESKIKAEEAGVSVEEYLGAAGKSYVALAGNLEEFVEAGDKVNTQFQDIGTQFEQLKETLSADDIALFEMPELENYKKEILDLISVFGEESDQAKELEPILASVNKRLEELSEEQKQAAETAAKLKKEQENLGKTIDGYQDSIAKIAVKADLFKLDEWEQLEQVVEAQRAALENLANQYVSGEINAEQYKKAVDVLGESYESNKQKLEAHTEQLEAEKKAADEAAEALEKQIEARKKFNDAYSGLDEAIENHIEMSKLEGKEIDELTAKREQYQATLKEMIAASEEMGELSTEEKEAIAELKEGIADLLEEEKRRADLLKEHEKALSDTNAAYEAQVKSIEAVKESLESFDGSTNAYEEQAQAMLESLKTLETQLTSYKQKMEELESVKGTEVFDPAVYDEVTQGIQETETAINGLETEFKELAEVSNGFKGIFDGLELSVKKNALQFQVFGDSLKQLEADAAAYKQSIDSLLNMKAENPEQWTAENEAELQKLISKYTELTAEIKTLQEAKEAEREATERQLEAEKKAVEFLNELKLAEEKFKDTGDLEAYYNNMISIFTSKREELLKAIAVGENVEENRKALEEVNAELENYTLFLDRTVKMNEEAKEATDQFEKSLEEINDTLSETGNGTISDLEKQIDAYEKAIQDTSKQMGHLTDEQLSGLEHWKTKLKELKSELERLKEPVEQIEAIQEKISDIDIQINASTDIDEQLSLVHEKMALIQEEAAITATLVIDQKEVASELDRLQKEYEKAQGELVKLSGESAKKQVDAIKKQYKGLPGAVVKELKKLKAGYEKEFANGIINADELKEKMKEVETAMEEATDEALSNYNELVSEYSGHNSPFEAIKDNMVDDIATLQDVYDSGNIDLEEFFELRKKIIEKAGKDEAKVLEELKENYINSLTGDDGELAQSLESTKNHYEDQIALIEDLAEAYGDVWADQQQDNAYAKFLESQEESFNEFFESQIDGYAKLMDSTADIFERSDLLDKFEKQYGDIENFYEQMEADLQDKKLSLQWDEETYQAGLRKLDEFYYNFKTNVETEKIKINVDAEEFKKILGEAQSYLDSFSKLANKVGDSVGGGLGETAKEIGTLASSIGDSFGGVMKIISGIQSADYASAFSGLLDVAMSVLDIFGSINDIRNTQTEYKADIKWAEGQSIEDALDNAKWREQADLSFGDDIHWGFLHSAGHERFEAMVRDVLEKRIEPMIGKIKELREEYAKLGEEAKSKGLESLGEYYDVAGEKLDEYIEKMENYRDIAAEYSADGGAMSEEFEQERIKHAGEKLTEYQKKVQVVASMTSSLTGAFDKLSQYGIESSGLGDMLDDLAEKATVKLANGGELGELAEDIENLKTLIDAVGDSFKTINDGMSKMGLASGKYKTELDALNKAYQDGEISQKEYISQVEKLADEITLLAEKHSRVDAAIKNSGRASVYLKEQLNELDQAYADGTMTQQEYATALQAFGDKAQEVAGTYSSIREAIEKVGSPAETLRVQFETLAEAMENGTINQEEFSKGLAELGEKASTLVNSLNEFDTAVGKINTAFEGTNIGIGQSFTDEMNTLKAALANGEISLDEFIAKVNDLSNNANTFYATFENVKSTISSGLSGAIKNFITFEFDDSMMGDLQAYVERVKGVAYASSEDFAAAFADMGKAGQDALINEFKYDQFKQSMDATLKQAILDSLLESLMMEGAIQGQIQELSAFIAAAMKDGLSQGELDAISTMMGDMQNVATEMAGVVSDTWQNVGGEIQTSSEEIEQIISDTLNGVGMVGDEATEATAQAGEEMTENVTEAIDGVSEEVEKEVNEAVDVAVDGMQTLPEEAEKTATEAGEAIAGGVAEGTEEVKRTMQETLESLTTTIEQLNVLMSEGIGSMDVSQLSEDMENAQQSISDTMGQIPENVTEKTLEAKNTMVEEMQNIPSEIDAVAQGVAASMDALNAQLGIQTDNEGQVQAIGGMIEQNAAMVEQFRNNVLQAVSDTLNQAQQQSLESMMTNMTEFALLLNQQGEAIFQEQLILSRMSATELFNEQSQKIFEMMQTAQEQKIAYIEETRQQQEVLKQFMLQISQQYFNVLTQISQTAVNKMVQATQAGMSRINAIVSSTMASMSAAMSMVQSVKSAANSAISAANKAKAAGSSTKVPAFASGGFIQSEGLAYVHPGEVVVPRIAVGKVFGQDIPTPSWTNNKTSNNSSMNLSISDGAIQIHDSNGVSASEIAREVLEELEKKLENEIHRHSEVSPY